MTDSTPHDLIATKADTLSVRPRARRSRRRSFLSALVLLGVIAGAGWAGYTKLWKAAKEELLTCRAKKAEFIYEITERGELESSANFEIRCEVESKDGKGMKIIEIVPEGSTVKEGDMLVRFDDSGLRSERTLQEIAVNTAQAAAAKAANDLESAEFAKKEYEFGTFIQEEEKAESELFVAEENLRRGEEYLRYSKKLEERGYTSTAATEADEFAVEKYRKELGVAETKLKVLREYTREKTLKKHDADIKTAAAALQSESAKLELENQKLTSIDAQIAKCIVKAPRGGQVVYDHDQDQWRGSDYAIKEGAVVYERRVVMRMPDPTQMRVKAKIAESKIDRLKTKMPATMQIEGLPGVVLKGSVSKVNDFPAEGNWFNASVKEYEVTVDVIDPPPGLRPGMTAQVAIRVEQVPEALQVPVQAVAEIEGRHFCVVRQDGGKLAPRAVALGTSNDKFLVIREGLQADEELLLDPRDRLKKMTLPEEKVLAADQRPQPAAPEQASQNAEAAAVPAVRDART